MSLPIKKTTVQETKDVIQTQIKPNKAPGYDLITGKLLQELPKHVIQFIAMIFFLFSCMHQF